MHKTKEDIIREKKDRIENFKLGAHKNKSHSFTPIGMVDYLDSVISACGGPDSAEILEVSRKFVKIKTTVPMHAGIFPQGWVEDNPKFHRVVTEILMSLDNIECLRWLPVDSGSVLIVEYKGEK